MPRYLRFGVGLLSLVLVTLLAGLLVAASLVPALTGWTRVALTSGSMAPSLLPGDVVVADPHVRHPVDPGTVLVFEDPNRPGLVTHRVIDARDDGSYRTKGDANPNPDSALVPQERVVAQGRLVVPMVGLPAVWDAQGHPERVIPALVLLAALIYASRYGMLDRYDPWQAAAAPRLRRRTRRRVALALLPVVFAAGIAGLAPQPSRGAHSASTANTNNYLATGSFCTPLTVTANADSYVHNGNKTANYGTATTARSAGGMEVERAFFRFSLPALGNCKFSSATLRLNGSSGATDGATRQVDVVQVAAEWAENTITWNNQPGVAGTASSVTAGSGVHSFNVSGQVSNMYAGTGQTSFRVSYLAESGGGGHRWYTTWTTRESSSNRPVVEIARVPA
jgi:signal peptidase I